MSSDARLFSLYITYHILIQTRHIHRQNNINITCSLHPSRLIIAFKIPFLSFLSRPNPTQREAPSAQNTSPSDPIQSNLISSHGRREYQAQVLRRAGLLRRLLGGNQRHQQAQHRRSAQGKHALHAPIQPKMTLHQP